MDTTRFYVYNIQFFLVNVNVNGRYYAPSSELV